MPVGTKHSKAHWEQTPW